jgi:hypothetical protein
MATIFSFVFLKKGYREYVAFSTAVYEQSGGRRTALKLHAAGEFVARGKMLFPNLGGSYGSFEAFWSAAFGGFGAFLFKPQNHGAAKVTDAIGTGDGSTKDFAATRRYVDAATLVVKVNGVVKTITTDYTLKDETGGAYALGTSAKLVVHFVTAPGATLPVVLTYDFYYPVRFEGDELPDSQEMEAGGLGGTNVADRTLEVHLREAGPGWSYASTPNAL